MFTPGAARLLPHPARLMVLLPVILAAAGFAVAAPTAAENYEKHCAGCHGANGKAQTRLGKKSGAKDLTDKSGAGKLSDKDVFQTIKLGRKDKRGEETMEPFGGELSDPEITALVTYVRRFTR